MAISERELEAARTARAVCTARADARASELAPIITDAQASHVGEIDGATAVLELRQQPRNIRPLHTVRALATAEEATGPRSAW